MPKSKKSEKPDSVRPEVSIESVPSSPSIAPEWSLGPGQGPDGHGQSSETGGDRSTIALVVLAGLIVIGGVSMARTSLLAEPVPLLGLSSYPGLAA